jgi:hypothetical protein
MKTKVIMILGGLFLLCQAATGWAATTTFTVSATVPLATGISIAVSSVNATTNVFTTLAPGTTALSFDTMTLSPTLGIFLPDHYFALDFGVTGGAGAADLTLTYTEGNNPNNPGTGTNGLGTKVTATFAKEVVSGSTTTETIVAPTVTNKARLIDLSATHVPFSEFTGGFARVYLGVWTGATGTPSDPTTGKPFSTVDIPGSYSGSLAITAVVN